MYKNTISFIFHFSEKSQNQIKEFHDMWGLPQSTFPISMYNVDIPLNEDDDSLNRRDHILKVLFALRDIGKYGSNNKEYYRKIVLNYSKSYGDISLNLAEESFRFVNLPDFIKTITYCYKLNSEIAFQKLNGEPIIITALEKALTFKAVNLSDEFTIQFNNLKAEYQGYY